MSRTNRIKYANQELYYGVFNASIIKISGYTVTLKDIFSDYVFDITFDISCQYDKTSANKSIWINQLGQIGYGDEKDLLDNFKYFPKSKVEKIYRLANKGDVHLFSFLKNLYNLSPFSPESNLFINEEYVYDDYYFNELFKYQQDSTVGGIIYINDKFEEKVIDKYIPSKKVSIIKNLNGNLDNISDFDLNDIKNKICGPYSLKGHFNFSYIKKYNHI